MRPTRSLPRPSITLLGLTLALAPGLAFAQSQPAGVPPPPEQFAGIASPANPAPFPVKYVDQGTFDPKLKGLLAPEGFKVELVADDPVVINPVGITFGPDGTLFVLEWAVDPITGSKWFEFKETFRYRDGSTKQIATMRKFVADVVKTLKLDPKTDTYTEAKPIISEELPSTVLYHDGWLYTTGRGTVRRYRQSRANGPWDTREVIAQGFCGFHHHQVSGLTIGLDNKLYVTSGDDDNFVEGSDGSRATVLRTGAVFRMNLDGSQVETYSQGYRNPYRDLALDDKYRFFHADNDNEDGSKFTGCRLVHVAEEADYGWRLRAGARCCRPDLIRGAVAGELPGKLPPMLKTGRGSPAGLLIYNDTYLPEQYRGLLYYPDVFRKLVRAYKVQEAGSTFEVTHEFEFLKSEDPLFRPCQMVTGPDGAIYVCDWRTDSGGAGRLSGDGSHGRIYRMKWVGTAEQPAIALRPVTSWKTLTKLPDAELVQSLNAKDFSDRVEARKELVRRGQKAHELVTAEFAAGKFTPAGRLAALGVLQARWSPEVAALFRGLLADPTADVRRLAAEALGEYSVAKDAKTHEALAKVLNDQSPGVRRAVVLAIGKVNAPGAADALVNAWKADDRHDRFLHDGILRGIERLGKPGVEALLTVANSGQKGDLDRVAEAFTALRTRPAADALPELLGNPHLAAAHRVELLQSYANYLLDPVLPVEPILAALLSEANPPPTVTVAALAIVGSAWQSSSAMLGDFILHHLDSADETICLAAIQAAEDTRLSSATGKLVALLNDAKRPQAERLAVLRALRMAGGPAATEPLAALLARPEPALLKVEALRALSVFAPDRARKLAAPLLDQPDVPLITEAVAVLGSTKDGARLVGEKYLAKGLPRELYPKVSDVLSKFPNDPALVKLTGEVLKGGLLVSLDPGRTAQIRKLVQTQGDPKRGRDVYLNTALVACASCHKLEGVGGQVGPDLTRVWDTHTLDKLLESILAPSKEIKEGYQSYRVTTAAGQVYTGLKVSENTQGITLRDATGRDVRVAKEDIEEVTAMNVSLMPENAIAQLSFEQFLDLLAFLKSQPAQEALRDTVAEFQVARSPAANFLKPVGFETAPTLPPNALPWQPRSIGVNGALPLSDLASPVTPNAPKAGTYALTWLYSPKPQKAQLHLTATDAAAIWVGGRAAFTPAVPLIPSQKPQESTLDCDVKAGWTPVLVKLAAFGPESSLRMQIHGDGVRTAATPQGAPATTAAIVPAKAATPR